LLPKTAKKTKEVKQPLRDQKYQIDDLVKEIETIPQQ